MASWLSIPGEGLPAPVSRRFASWSPAFNSEFRQLWMEVWERWKSARRAPGRRLYILCNQNGERGSLKRTGTGRAREEPGCRGGGEGNSRLYVGEYDQVRYGCANDVRMSQGMWRQQAVTNQVPRLASQGAPDEGGLPPFHACRRALRAASNGIGTPPELYAVADR